VTRDDRNTTATGRPARLATVLRWPFGIALVSWR
jgi:hypothetical protein